MGLAAGGSVYSVPGVSLGEGRQGLSELTKVVSGYADEATIHGASVACLSAGQRPREIKVVARIKNPDTLKTSIQRLSSETRVSVLGNDFSFEADGCTYSVNNLSENAYEERLREFAQGKGCYFSQEPLCGRLRGLEGARSIEEIRPLSNANTAAPPCSQFASWFDTVIASAVHGLAMSDSAKRRGAWICSQPATEVSSARTVDDVIERISFAAEQLDSAAMRELIASSYVNASYRKVDGRSSIRMATVVGSVERLFPKQTRSSVWLALMVGKIDDGGALHRALLSRNALYANSTKTALAGAVEILESGKLELLGLSQKSQTSSTLDAQSLIALEEQVHGDLDGDGVPSLVEYALGADPLDPRSQPNASLARETEGGMDYLTLTYQRDGALGDIEYIPQTTTTLDGDSWRTDGVEDELVSVDGDIEIRKARVPLRGKTQYLRVLVRQK